MKFNLPADFYSRYWQREPLLIRQAIENFRSPVNGDDLAGLACMEGVESRIIIEKACAVPWEVRHGPFAEETFTTLPETHWTLLVQGVDHWDDEVAALRRLFPNIANWRLDDVMVSYAAVNGSVGPHYDSYDVFLLQGSGQRRWRLGGRADSNTQLRQHPELRLLKSFRETQEYLLEPGDALYVPPNVAHWGIAETECVTFSIGFRAPSIGEIIEGSAAAIASELSEDLRYTDQLSDTAGASHPGEITADVVHRLRELVLEYCAEETIAEWFGSFATEPKHLPDTELSANRETGEELQSGKPCRPGSDSRFAFRRQDSGFDLFADGVRFECPLAAEAFIHRLCSGAALQQSDLKHWSGIVSSLLAQGSLRFD
ncbi:MAG: 50S ribosomal protein L16 3-hydroxylase [Gammaproteobacteria bacterium]|jgi:50S ribosomal protein L16 3-hydroxylase